MLYLNKYIVRGKDSGIFYCEIVKRVGPEVEMVNCKMIYYWTGAKSLNELALNGSSQPDKCLITCACDNVVITDCVQIIQCSLEAINCLDGVEEWTM